MLQRLDVLDHAFQNDRVLLLGAGVVFLDSFEVRSFPARSLWVARSSRILTNARTISNAHLDGAVASEASADNMATPCSVNAEGIFSVVAATRF